MIVIGMTGSRFWLDPKVIADTLDELADGHNVVLLRHGKCPPRRRNSGSFVRWETALELESQFGSEFRGADWLADRHARRRGWQVREYPADWAAYRLRAGMVRNGVMVADGADVWAGFLHEGSRGTKDCLLQAERALIPVVRRWENAPVDGER